MDHTLILDFLSEFSVINEKKPLKLGILNDIIKLRDEKERIDISNRKIRMFLYYHTYNHLYLKNVVGVGKRYDLEGNYVEDVSESELEYAIEKLKENKKLMVKINKKKNTEVARNKRKLKKKEGKPKVIKDSKPIKIVVKKKRNFSFL